MFKRFDVHPRSNPYCYKSVKTLEQEDFRYFDKDGYELNIAEQKFYAAMGFPICHGILNHTCWQEPWFELESRVQGLMLDHCMILHRCAYSLDAKAQIESLSKEWFEARSLLQIKPKWGFDFDLNGLAPDGTVFEVLHIEVDSKDYDYFLTRSLIFDYFVRHADWYSIRDSVWDHRDQWQHLEGFAQNDWKANFILGWNKAEYTTKSI